MADIEIFGDYPTPAPPSGVGLRLRIELSVMMFLQYTIGGAWMMILGLHLQELEDFRRPTVVDLLFTELTLQTDTKINLIYMALAIAFIFSPLIAGQFVDRYFSTDRFLAFSHFVGGILMLIIARLSTFQSIFWFMIIYTLIFAPTLALTNSLAFHHLPNGEKHFSGIRLWGTFGFIAIGWALGLFLRQTGADVDTGLYASAGLSMLMAGYCLFLPSTPPAKDAANPYAFLDAIRLLRRRSFAVIVIVAFLVATQSQFYYVLTPIFFNQGGGPYDTQALANILADDGEITQEDKIVAAELVAAGDVDGNGKLSLKELEQTQLPAAGRILQREEQVVTQKGGGRLQQGTVPMIMTIGQVCEMLMLLLLPLLLQKLGFRVVIASGIAAWSLRFLLFSWCPSSAVIIGAQALHGLCYGFFFIGIFIYADRIAGNQIKASLQALLLMVTNGVGMLIGAVFAGPVSDYFQRNWHHVFLVPAVLTAACALLFAIGFRDDRRVPQG